MEIRKGSTYPVKREKRKKRTLFSSLGFTLAEILVVIAVIGLLSSIIFAITSGTREQGRIAKGLYFSQHLHNSLGSYAVGTWSFDEGFGTTANDTSGWGNNGTLVNTPAWRCANEDSNHTPSGQGCSLEFDGENDYVNLSVGNNLDMGTNDRTYEAWFKINGSYASARTLFASGAGGGGLGNDGVWAYVNSNTSFLIDFSDGTASRLNKTFSAGKSIHDGVWHHFAAVFDRDDFLDVYFDGVISSSGGLNISSQSGDVNDNYIQRLGAWASGGTYPFNGFVDEVRIYNTSLSLLQIQSQYYAGLQRLLAKNLISETEYQQRLVKT